MSSSIEPVSESVIEERKGVTDRDTTPLRKAKASGEHAAGTTTSGPISTV